MERTVPIAAAKRRFWLLVSAAFLLWYLFLSFYNSEFAPSKSPVLVTLPNNNKNDAVLVLNNLALLHDEGSIVIRPNVSEARNNAESPDPCSGRYIFVHDVPSRFNDDMFENCRSLSNWTDMCESTSNDGFGPPLSNAERVYSNKGWFATNQFSLEVIFHSRMKRYECLTNDSSLASAIFVPYYAGLDVARYLWGRHNTSVRDSAALELAEWLRDRPEWRKLSGRDHFLVAGSITWDFRRLSDDESDWGNKFLLLPETRNMSVLTIESSPWHGNDFAVPYPTYFHPSSGDEVAAWQGRMRRQRRRFAFSFAGAPRPNMPESIRGQIIEQCRGSRGKCRLLECDSGSSKCRKPDVVMRMFQSSVFCLQPPGDSSTRRSAFDSILAGCVPVFFHPGSAYLQYLWYLPRDYTKYSVFIPDHGVKNGSISIAKTLLGISKERVEAMREEVIRLIPSVIYAAGKLEGLEDAFDISVKEVLERVRKIRKGMEESEDLSSGYGEELSWKYNFFGNVSEQEWDRYFSRS